MNIITNNVPRNLVYGFELSPAEKADFDYIEDIDNHYFFKYRGNIYDPSEFMCCPPELASLGWQGYAGDSYFSGVAIKYVEDCEQVVVALVLS